MNQKMKKIGKEKKNEKSTVEVADGAFCSHKVTGKHTVPPTTTYPHSEQTITYCEDCREVLNVESHAEAEKPFEQLSDMQYFTSNA